MKQTYRFAHLLACASLIAGTLSLWGCGSASTYDPITPTRLVAFGDGLVDVGQTGRVDSVNNSGIKYRFTVNQVETSTTFNIGTTFIEVVASYFGFGSVSSALNTVGNLPGSGAYSYGEYGAMVLGDLGVGADSRGCVKDATTAKKYCANSLKAQIDLFFTQGSPSSNDLFVISIGTGDIMSNGSAAAGLSKAQTDAAMLAAAKGLAAQVKRLTDAGAKYVLVVGPPNVGRSPWASENGNDATKLQNLSYNTGSGYTSMGSEGLAQIQSTFGNKTNNPVLFVEISGLVNTLTDGSNATFVNKTNKVCKNTTAAADPVYMSIDGTLGQISAAVCTTATASLNGDPGTFVYADGVNFTPSMQGQFYSQAVTRMRLAAWIN